MGNTGGMANLLGLLPGVAPSPESKHAELINALSKGGTMAAINPQYWGPLWGAEAQQQQVWQQGQERKEAKAEREAMAKYREETLGLSREQFAEQKRQAQIAEAFAGEKFNWQKLMDMEETDWRKMARELDERQFNWMMETDVAKLGQGEAELRARVASDYLDRELRGRVASAQIEELKRDAAKKSVSINTGYLGDITATIWDPNDPQATLETRELRGTTYGAGAAGSGMSMGQIVKGFVAARAAQEGAAAQQARIKQLEEELLKLKQAQPAPDIDVPTTFNW